MHTRLFPQRRKLRLGKRRSALYVGRRRREPWKISRRTHQRHRNTPGGRNPGRFGGGSLLSLYSTGCSTATTVFFGSTAPGDTGATTVTGGRGSLLAPERSSHLPKIIFPAVVCRTEVTETSMVLPIILRALSTTTMVPSSR